MLHSTVALTVAAATSFAVAQDAAIEIRVLGDATPEFPEVVIEVWARIPATDFAFNATISTLFASESEFRWLDECRCEPRVGARIAPQSIRAITGGPPHLPPLVYGDPTNPIRLYRAGWRPASFEPRIIELTTETERFEVYPEQESSRSESRLDRLVEGRAVIHVRDAECYADCDASGDLDFLDFLCFQNLYAASDPLADCDLDGQLDFFDFLCFQNEFVAGCP